MAGGGRSENGRGGRLLARLLRALGATVGDGAPRLGNEEPSLLEASLDPVILVDGRGAIREWNRRAEALFGWSAAEVRGAPLDERLLPPGQRSWFRQTLAELLGGRREPSERRAEARALRRDGDEVPVVIAVTRLRQNVEPRFAVFVRDISEAKAVEEELIRARDVAIAATSAKSEFLATMSHEIRTPMNGVLGMTELLLRTKLDEHQKHLAGVAYTSAESLLGIINDILDFSKIESGKMVLEDQIYDLHRAVGEAVALLAGSAHARALELCCEIEPNVPRQQRGDPSRLRQILTNLIGNGIKFTPVGEVVVRVAVDSSDPSPHLRLSVSDTGIGMDAAVRERVFEPFRQADGSTTRNYGGTGLGLAICKRLVEEMGGSIEVETLPKRGSTFTFTLPLTQVGDPPGTSRVETSLVGRSVLIVDDNAASREILARQTASWGMPSIAVESAEEALATLERSVAGSGAPDVAIVDLDMPAIGGLELLEQAATRGLLPASRILVLSTIGLESAVSAARQRGCGGHLVKPPLRDELRRMLEGLLASPSPPSRPGAASDAAPARGSSDLHARILLVEDNPVNREVALELLQTQACDVDVAGNGFEAVAAVETSAEPYDAVLMDCEMPRMDGFEATREIRVRERNHSLPRLPIVAMTANVLKDTREACRSAGMDDYLGKPLTARSLRDVLDRVLAGDRGAAGHSALEDPDGPVAGPRRVEAARPEAPAADAAPGDAYLDPSALEQLRRLQRPGKTDLATRAIDLYLGSAPGLLETLQEAVREEDANAARQAAHGLKSSSANLGATRLAEICRRIESLAAESRTKELEPLVAEALRLYELARVALVRERRE